MAKTATKSAARKTTPAKKTAAKKTPAKKSAPKQSSDPLLMEFFIDELKDIYWAEKKLVTTLPKLRKAATSQELQQAFADHLETTKTHVSRLEEVFSILGKKAQAKKCEAMEGLAKEGESIIEDTDAGTATRDVGLIMAAQKAEHYEIATYGGLRQLATTLGLEDVAELLSSTLEEEKETDELLTSIAENNVNYEAAEEGDEEEGEEDEEDYDEEEEDMEDEEEEEEA
ncbi:YciE/YciF ferroxidase family protein [Sediminibacterium ginsengisoli]|uniref:Ferritin-like metal-binding protein YciE n=1 Tax=Sediminibacterium ginsengisoli TaxID=413434 RepID=A0A1T4RL93_9BACT|nr:ferritin-like domain-containing protein [Sediminibacterium ginsengisoli]SKA16732.1 Ferritin-like metal-binding protein YciE [Sediminibacterium ginsengisoli]